MSQVGRNVLWLLASQLATWVASLVTVIVAPGLLGSTDFGDLSYATGFVMFFTLVAGLGTSTLMSREVARDHDVIGPYLWNAILLKIVISIVFSLIAFGLAFALGNRGSTLVLVAIGCGGMIIQLIGEVSAGALFGLQRMAGVAVWSVVQVYVQTIFGMLVLFLGWGVVAYAAVLTTAGLLPALAQLWMVVPYLRGHRHFDAAIWKLLVTGGLPLMALASFNMIYGTVNVPILHYIAGPDQVGWYSLAARWVGIPIFVTAAVSSAFFPEFARHGKGPSPEFAPLVNQAIRIVLLVTIPAAVGIGLVADDLIRFLYRDGDYDRSIVLMQILALQMPITAMDTLLATALVASDRLSRYLWVSAGAALLNPLACIVTINLTQDRYGNGAIGTVLVVVGTELFVMTGAWWLRAPGVMDRGVLGHIGRIVVACVAMAAAVVLARDLPLGVEIATGIGVYAAAGLAIGAVSIDEVKEISRRVYRR